MPEIIILWMKGIGFAIALYIMLWLIFRAQKKVGET